MRPKKTNRPLLRTGKNTGWGGSLVLAGILLVLLGLILIYVWLAKAGVFQRVGDFVVKFFHSFKQ